MHDISAMPRGKRLPATQGRRRLAVVVVTCVVALTLLVAGTAAGHREQALKAGGILTIATSAAPSTLDPASGQNSYSPYYDLAYDPLVIKSPDGSYKPGLALSWRYGPRNKSFSIKLRPGVRFSDGTRLTANVVRTWVEHAKALPGGYGATYFSALTDVKITGPLSLTLLFNTPTPLLELDFSQLLEMGMIGSAKAVAANTLATTTDGAGPYMLDKGASVTGDHYTYVPNPYYWNKSAVHWKKVVVRVITNPTTALSALQTGQVQVALGQPVASVGAATRAGIKNNAPLTLFLALSLIDRGGKVAPALGDLRVRQALNYAIDRKAVAAVVGAGLGRPIDQMAVPGDDSYDPKLDNAYPYDPTKAKQLLAAAGYGKGLTLSAIVWQGVGQDTMSQAIAGELAKVGVTLNLDIRTDVGDYFQKLSGATYPTAAISFGRIPAATDYQVLYGPNAALFNPFKSTNSQLSRLYYRLIATPTAKMPAVARQMQAVLVKQAWFVPVVATPLVVFYNPSVTGVNATPQRNVIYASEIAPTH
jgi:peptide/nickel transport system substrate-binding protein